MLKLTKKIYVIYSLRTILAIRFTLAEKIELKVYGNQDDPQDHIA